MNDDITILENGILLRFFRKLNNTTINEITDILEYYFLKMKVHGLPLSLILIAFHNIRSLNTKGHIWSEKTHSNYLGYMIRKTYFTQVYYVPNAQFWIKMFCNDSSMPVKQTLSTP